MASVGHRRKLLSAIAALSGTFAEPAAVAKIIRLDPPVYAAAERRQLTVMFCDLVGSTAMSARLDPEDMREMIAAYHQCCASLIERGGGFVAKYMGDGVLGYFGYPQAHEHDAELAVKAGLAIVEAAPTLRTAAGAPLHVRVGIATGIVIVGDLLGSERRRNVRSSAARQTWPPGSKGSLSPTASSSPRTRANCWANCSNLSISARRSSRASREQRGHSRR